jgi:hypothetical protein
VFVNLPVKLAKRRMKEDGKETDGESLGVPFPHYHVT